MKTKSLSRNPAGCECGYLHGCVVIEKGDTPSADEILQLANNVQAVCPTMDIDDAPDDYVCIQFPDKEPEWLEQDGLAACARRLLGDKLGVGYR